MRKIHHKVRKLRFSGDKMILTVDGKEYEFTLSDISAKLANASDAERENYQVSPSGYGIHWPSIDEDLSIDGLLGIVHRPDTKKKTVKVSHS